MVLTTQLFDRIVGIAASSEQQHDQKAVLPVGCRRAAEKRDATRFTLGQRAVICRDSGPKTGIWDTVMLKDISLKGIGFFCHEVMNPGDTFMLKLADRQGQSIRIRCAIRRCEAGGIGGVAFRIGATFEQLIQQLELRLNDDDDDLEKTGRADGWQKQEAVEVDSQCIAIAPTRFTVAKVAASFFKTMGPANWLRKRDDYSSIS